MDETNLRDRECWRVSKAKSPEAVSPQARQAVVEAGRMHELGYNCAETVLGAVATAMGADPAPLRIATGFGGGVGRTGDICGAVTGAVMALGWIKGRTRPDDKETYAKVAATVRTLLADFRAEYGTLTCSALTGYDLSDPAILTKFGDDKVRRQKCAGFIDTAARLAAEALVAWPEG